MGSFNSFQYFTMLICILPLAQGMKLDSTNKVSIYLSYITFHFKIGAGEFCNLETKCKNPDEKCHVFFERFYYEAGYCGPRSCTSDR